MTGRKRRPPDPRRQFVNSISEASLQNTVVDLAQRLQYWVWHDTDSRKNKAGLPDLILIRPPRVIFAELKRQSGRMRTAQIAVLGLLAACPGVESYVWRPDDLEEIKRVLQPREKPGARPV